MNVHKISDVMHRMEQDFKIPNQEESKQAPDDPMITAEGVVRCRFDMFVRYYQHSKRHKKEFCYRGDHFEKREVSKMLWNLVRMFKNKYTEFLIAELYDNTIPKNDERRIILRYNDKKIFSRLQEYDELLKEYPVPDWLKGKL